MLLLPERRAGEAWKYSENMLFRKLASIEHFLHSKPHALLRHEDLTSQRFHNTKSNLAFFLNTQKDLN
jgi:hypothetical protein